MSTTGPAGKCRSFYPVGLQDCVRQYAIMIPRRAQASLKPVSQVTIPNKLVPQLGFIRLPPKEPAMDAPRHDRCRTSTQAPRHPGMARSPPPLAAHPDHVIVTACRYCTGIYHLEEDLVQTLPSVWRHAALSCYCRSRARSDRWNGRASSSNPESKS